MAKRKDEPAIDEEAVRRTAYFLWEQAGRPQSGAEAYWYQALEKHRQQRTYDRWLNEGVRGDEPGLEPPRK